MYRKDFLKIAKLPKYKFFELTFEKNNFTKNLPIFVVAENLDKAYELIVKYATEKADFYGYSGKLKFNIEL